MKTNFSTHSVAKTISRWALLLIALCVFQSTSPFRLPAKELPLNAIVVYQNASAWTYLQASDIQLNAKIEMKDCGNEQTHRQIRLRQAPQNPPLRPVHSGSSGEWQPPVHEGQFLDLRRSRQSKI